MSSSSQQQGSNVELTIRCALHSFQDMAVSCPMDWNVADLKEHIFRTCPTNPNPARQRLIYAGQCLRNFQKIGDIMQRQREGLETSEDLGPQVMHLVCAPIEPPPAPAASADGVRRRPNATPAAAEPGANAAASGTQPPAATINLPGFGTLVHSYPTAAPAVPLPTYTLPPNPTPEQMAYYANCMYYQQMMIMSSFYNPQYFSPMMQPSSAMHMFPMNHGGGVNLRIDLTGQQGIRVGQAPNAAPVADDRAAAGGAGAAAAADDEEHVNDIIGVVYKSIRVIFFLMVLYLYSSVERFFLVFMIICILWFVHRRREQNNINANRQFAQDANAPAQANAAQPPQNDDNNNEIHPPADAAAPGAAEAAPPTAQNGDVAAAAAGEAQNLFQQQFTVNRWNVFWSTISAFFLSLIPEVPVPVED